VSGTIDVRMLEMGIKLKECVGIYDCQDVVGIKLLMLKSKTVFVRFYLCLMILFRCTFGGMFETFGNQAYHNRRLFR